MNLNMEDFKALLLELYLLRREVAALHLKIKEMEQLETEKVS